MLPPPRDLIYLLTIDNYLEVYCIGLSLPHRSIAHLHNLATASQAKSQAASIVTNDFRQKASEYRAQAARIREILESAGMAQESLPSNVVSSAQVLANVANLLNIRDIELSRKRKLTNCWRRFSQPITQDSKNSQRPSLGTKRSVSLNKKQEEV